MNSTRIHPAFWAIAIAAIVLGAWWVFSGFREVPPEPEVLPAPEEAVIESFTIGTSTEGRAIEAYRFGNGETPILFVGGIHGGYEWNSVLLAYSFIDQWTAHPEEIPANVSVYVIPVLNPDGLYAVAGSGGRFDPAMIAEPAIAGTGRFNANGVDLNRNFDCKWKPESMWRGNVVSAGERPFSEPEAEALRVFVGETAPRAAIFWHSQANTVYASECTAGVLPETLGLMQAYADAAGYNAVSSFDAYPVSGDAEGWLASIGIPAITVELATHESIEWEKNRAGVGAVFGIYGN